MSSETGTRGVVVAIDGPSGSGKSTISRRVAETLELAYLDTGAMFRAAAWWCRDQGVDFDDAAAVTQTTEGMPLRMVTDPLAPTVMVGETEVEPEIRSSEISTIVSKVATNLDVRALMKQWQRDIIAQESSCGRPGIVVEGRDITTVIAPDAQVRILLAASAEARLARRTAELHDTVDEATLAATHDQVIRRDRDDATVSEFFKAADGVTRLDTSHMTFDESYEAVLRLVRDGIEHTPAPRNQQEEHR